MENKIWTTKNGDEIEISKMDDQHLLNTIQMLEKQAEEGVVEVNGSNDYYGTDGDTVFLQGKDYLNSIKEYSWLKEEAKKRELKNSSLLKKTYNWEDDIETNLFLPMRCKYSSDEIEHYASVDWSFIEKDVKAYVVIAQQKAVIKAMEEMIEETETVDMQELINLKKPKNLCVSINKYGGCNSECGCNVFTYNQAIDDVLNLLKKEPIVDYVKISKEELEKAIYEVKTVIEEWCDKTEDVCSECGKN